MFVVAATEATEVGAGSKDGMEVNPTPNRLKQGKHVVMFAEALDGRFIIVAIYAKLVCFERLSGPPITAYQARLSRGSDSYTFKKLCKGAGHGWILQSRAQHVLYRLSPSRSRCYAGRGISASYASLE